MLNKNMKTAASVLLELLTADGSHGHRKMRWGHWGESLDLTACQAAGYLQTCALKLITVWVNYSCVRDVPINWATSPVVLAATYSQRLRIHGRPHQKKLSSNAMNSTGSRSQSLKDGYSHYRKIKPRMPIKVPEPRGLTLRQLP